MKGYLTDESKLDYIRAWRKKPLGKLHTKKDILSAKLRKNPNDKAAFHEYMEVLKKIEKINDKTLTRNPKAQGNFIWTTLK